MPFFQPKTITINMLSTFFISMPHTLSSPNAVTAIASNRLAPISSSIENALLAVIFCTTTNEFTNIL